VDRGTHRPTRRTGRLARVLAISFAILALMCAPAMAAGGTSAGAGYNPPGPRIQQEVQAPSSGLPFTGLDLVPLLAVSATLLLVGVGLHRVLGTRG
jgi:hypothetical protein